jgi:hypothetical protein
MRTLLLDEGFMSGTLTACGLERSGCTVDVIAATGGRGAYRDGGATWQLAPRVGDPRLMDRIDVEVRRTAPDVVYPITEPLQQLLWDEAPDWHARVFPHVPAGQRAARRDKRVMSAVVGRTGVPVPPERAVSSDADVERAVRDLGLPIVIKGSAGRGGQMTHICNSLRAAVGSARDSMRRGVEPFAQVYVRGVTCLAGGLFDRGRLLRFYAGVKTLQVPSRVGPAAEITSIDDPELNAIAARVGAAAGHTGLASMDLMRDDRGAYSFLELNPRPWGSIGAALDAGVDLFDALVRLWQAEFVTPRLEFRRDVGTRVFPLYLLAPAGWLRTGMIRALVPDVRRAFEMARARPRLARHVVHRLVRVGLNW